MLAELDAIVDPAEHRRFARGAIVAIARLGLAGLGASIVDALARFARPYPRGLSMKLTSQALLRRHATPFVISFAVLTLLLLANYAARLMPQLSARGASPGTLLEFVLLSLPHTVALSIPMGVFLAVAWVFTGLGREGVLESMRRQPHGLRRLIGPVLGAAAVVAALTFVSNTQVVPRANAQLGAVILGAPMRSTDRTMTLGELRAAAREARAAAGADAVGRALRYEVEIQKKFALAAACMFLALAGAATVIRFPRGGRGLVFASSGLVFTGYWLSLIAGESLADQRIVSPVLGMWMANAVLLGVVVLLLRRRPDTQRTSRMRSAGG